MKSRIAALVTLAVAFLAMPARAHVVEVTTSVPGESVADEARLKTALAFAVDRVLADVVAFRPTLVALTAARMIGDRLYVRLLLADEEGEATIGEFEAEDGVKPDEKTTT